MTLGNRIAHHRKNLNLTQDALAQRLGVTNQAVSKWESDQCCPDVTLLPKLADIFGITIDELFGREVQTEETQEPEQEKSGPDFGKLFDFDIKKMFGSSLNAVEKAFDSSLDALDRKVNQKKWEVQPEMIVWPDDETLRIVAYIGHKLVESTEDLEKLTFHYEGPALNIDSQISVTCGDVSGDVDAGRDVTCKIVDGDIDAGRDVNCGDVMGNVDSGRDISCGNVMGHVDAGGSVNCGNVEGNVDAGSSVSCGQVEGSVDAGSHVVCGNVGGDVDAGTDVKCGDVGGDVDAGGNVECGIVEGDIDAGVHSGCGNVCGCMGYNAGCRNTCGHTEGIDADGSVTIRK